MQECIKGKKYYDFLLPVTGDCDDDNDNKLMMMDCSFRMVDQREELSFISSRDHYQMLPQSQSPDNPPARFKLAHNLSSVSAE